MVFSGMMVECKPYSGSWGLE